MAGVAVRFLMDRFPFKINRALTDAEIAAVYALERHYKIAICPWTGPPSSAPSEWTASGRLWRVVPFLWKLHKRGILQ